MFRLATFSLLICVATVTVFAQDAPYLDETRKFRGDYGHGNSARTYQQHAQDYSRQLYYQAQVQPTSPKAVLVEHATAVQTNIEKSNKSLAALKAAHKDDAAAQKLIASIEEHHAKVLKNCGHLHDCCKNDAGVEMIGDCCADIDADIEAAKADLTKLLKHLKIDALPAPKKVEKKAEKKK